MRSTDEPYTVLEPGDPHPLGWKVPPIDDLRSALEYLKTMPGQFIETDREVDPNAELAGVYRYVGAGGTVMRPTRIGPAMMFNTVKGYPGARVLVGLLASRERVSHLLGAPARQLGIQMAKARLTVTPPVNVERELALCQEVVHKADEPGFDLRHLLPAPTNTPQDAGPYFCMGLVLGSDPDDRGNVDVTIHRLCVQGPDELSIFFAPGRHIDAFRQKAEAQGKPLAVSVNMGLDPAIHIGAEFEAPTTPFGFDELCVAGGLRGSRSSWSSASRWRRKRSHGPRSLSRARSCRTSAWRKTRTRTPARRCPSSRAIPETPTLRSRSSRSRRSRRGKTRSCRPSSVRGRSMSALREFRPRPASTMPVRTPCPAFSRMSTRTAQEAANSSPCCSWLRETPGTTATPGGADCASRVSRAEERDPGRRGRGSVRYERRSLGDADPLPGRPRHDVPAGRHGTCSDPSQTPDYNPRLPSKGTTCKTVFDCTVPFHLKEHFVRAQFREVDPRPFAPELFRQDPS